MIESVQEISWREPILPRVPDPAWEEVVRKRFGRVPDILYRVSRSPWLREAIMNWPWYKPQEVSQRYHDICGLITAQENSCRYCYGVARSYLRISGFGEKTIKKIERNAHLAELDEKERAFIQFCRNLSRSNPRPPKSDRKKLIELGYSPKAVAEMAFLIGNHCFINRVSTFISIPPMEYFENFSPNFITSLFLPLLKRRLRKYRWQESNVAPQEVNAFSSLIQAFEGIPAAKALNDALMGAMSSEVLSQDLKVLMFAVVARSLKCEFCQAESEEMAANLGFAPNEFEEALRTLDSPRLNEQERKILSWTRETIHYQIDPIQNSVAELSQELDEVVLLEAIGMAALANTAVRLAVLLG